MFPLKLKSIPTGIIMEMFLKMKFPGSATASIG